MKLLMKQKESHRLRKQTHGSLGEEYSQGVWEGHVHPAVFKKDNHKDLL